MRVRCVEKDDRDLPDDLTLEGSRRLIDGFNRRSVGVHQDAGQGEAEATPAVVVADALLL